MSVVVRRAGVVGSLMARGLDVLIVVKVVDQGSWSFARHRWMFRCLETLSLSPPLKTPQAYP